MKEIKSNQYLVCLFFGYKIESLSLLKCLENSFIEESVREV